MKLLHSQAEDVVGLVNKRQKPINANSNTVRTQNVKAVLKGNFVDFAPAKARKAPAFAFVG